MRGQMTHLDTDVLAEFRAGLITGRRGTRIVAHLAVCDRCTALSDQLAEVSALLAAVPAPAMPDGVAHRLDTVLAAESSRREDSERARDGSSRDRATHARPAKHRGMRLVTLRVLAPAAAIIVLAAGAYGLTRIGGGPTSSATSRSAAAPAAREPSAAPVEGAASGAMEPAFKGSSGFSVITSGIDYQHATLRQQLEQQKGALTGRSQAPSAQLKACVRQVTSGVSPGTPVLVENAHYQGQPATVIVASSAHGYTAWVMAPGCSAALDMITLPGTYRP
jgi:hypothetical protein